MAHEEKIQFTDQDEADLLFFGLTSNELIENAMTSTQVNAKAGRERAVEEKAGKLADPDKETLRNLQAQNKAAELAFVESKLP